MNISETHNLIDKDDHTLIKGPTIAFYKHLTRSKNPQKSAKNMLIVGAKVKTSIKPDQKQHFNNLSMLYMCSNTQNVSPIRKKSAKIERAKTAKSRE